MFLAALVPALVSSPAFAADEAAPAPEDELPIPTLTLDRIPPRTSYEMGLHISYGEVAYFREVVAPWVGFGLRAGYGKNFGLHRVGVTGTFSAEGELGVNTYLSLEPSLTWDHVKAGPKGGLQLGAGIGPALGYTSTAVTIDGGHGFGIAPTASVRVGWSQGWTQIGRRLFVVFEPKVRLAPDGLAPQIAVVVGSGGGR